MKTFDIVIGNGCSFTEGGGLNNEQIHEFLTGEFVRDPIKLDAYMFKNSYPAFLGKLLNCKWYNNSVSCASNDLIIQRAMDILEKYKNKKTLIINQLSIPSRLGIRKANKYYSFNSLDGRLQYDTSENGIKNPKYRDSVGDVLEEFYKKYVLEIFDEDAYWKNFTYTMKLFNAWCERNNILNYWITYMNYEHVSHIDRVIPISESYEGVSEWSDKLKLQLKDIKDIPIRDSHLSIEGHKQLANIIYEKIR